ncbi:MAG: hypothetical protein HZA01_04985 [Nitrospinae bacterium]|nr:hypothetical protein [Nitrospinota bacterium]
MKACHYLSILSLVVWYLLGLRVARKRQKPSEEKIPALGQETAELAKNLTTPAN